MSRTMSYILIAVLVVLIGGIFFGLVRAIRGPRRANRILGINMIGSLSTTALAVVAVLLDEVWLLDVCLVYCLISFLAVVVLAKIHILQKQEDQDHE